MIWHAMGALQSWAFLGMVVGLGAACWVILRNVGRGIR